MSKGVLKKILAIVALGLFIYQCLPLKLLSAQSQKSDISETEQMLYKRVKKDNVNFEIGCVLKRVDNETFLEVSILATGKGIDFRKWTPEKTVLIVDSKIIKPVKESNFYVSKESFASGAAPFIFAAIGSQYQQRVNTAVQSEGVACPAGATKTTSAAKGSVSEAIDRIGMTSALGVFASQAKGEITGARLTFDVTGCEGRLESAELKTVVRNEDAHKEVKITVPVSFVLGELIFPSPGQGQWEKIKLTGPGSKIL